MGVYDDVPLRYSQANPHRALSELRNVLARQRQQKQFRTGLVSALVVDSKQPLHYQRCAAN
jgi:hypothetical protein